MKKLGIIGAMEEEVETLVATLQDRKEMSRAGSVFYEGKLEDLDVVVVRCGIGKVNAAICAQILCSEFAVTHLVNTGIAGSLDPQLDIGDLVVSRDGMYHDFDTTVFGYPMGQVPGSPVRYEADKALAELAFRAAESVNPGHTKLGGIASGDQFISGKEQKEKIISVTGAACTEMEGAAIAHTAWRNGVPFVILRAISDKADDSAEMDYPTFERIAAHRCAQVTVAMAKALRETE